MVLDELTISQASSIVIMFCCGVLIQSLYFAKVIWQSYSKAKGTWVLKELLFWAASAAALSRFLYYCDYGRISFHSALGFLTGLLLWKKAHCGIITLWAKKDVVDNSKVTAKLSTSTKQERKGWKKEGQNVPKKKKKHVRQPRKKAEEIRPSETRNEEDFC